VLDLVHKDRAIWWKSDEARHEKDAIERIPIIRCAEGAVGREQLGKVRAVR
jgi:hypothetical protein